jgi:hypothetical protein
MEPAINWEIWIENGKRAHPLCIAMTYKQAPNFPHFFLVEYAEWNLNLKLRADTLIFKITANAKQIEFGAYQAEQKSISMGVR